MRKANFFRAIVLSLALILTASAVEYIYPQTPFEPSQARELLASGESQVKGHLENFVHTNIEVALYPLTKHFEEHLVMREHLAGQAEHRPAIDARARSCRLVTTAKGGVFEFKGIKPGRYYLEYPAMYNSGHTPAVDATFNAGGCVYILPSQGQVIEVPEDGLELILSL